MSILGGSVMPVNLWLFQRHTPQASVIRVPSSICLEKLTRGERPGAGKLRAMHDHGPASCEWSCIGHSCSL